MSLKEFNDPHLNYYLEIIDNCKNCKLYSELDDVCVVEDKKIIDIIKSDLPVCPIGEW